jgi:hypothetical protein
MGWLEGTGYVIPTPERTHPFAKGAKEWGTRKGNGVAARFVHI